MKEYNPYEFLRITVLHNGNYFTQVKYTPRAHQYIKHIIRSNMFTYEKGWTIAINDLSGKMIVELAPEEFLDMKY